ncbi:MAG: LacI family DNA-binding transcriptional regulator [bacterium]|nr:LacI family DNA-binding transcriptional regulator [bacterium]MDY4100483.1 LacI family DNA-binding transcriptional regulator [Lachnospiraceae bacterium]
MSIKEIAKRTGASQATVSRVLNNPEHRCSDPKLRDKIWKAAMELHYVPNEAARDLKHGKPGDKQQTYYVQVLVTRSDVGQSDPFIEELLRVIESEIHKHLCILTHVWHKSVFSDERRCKKEDINRIVADLCKETEGNSHGLIIIGKISKHAIPAIRKHFTNVVAVNRNQLGQQLDEVFCDGRKIAYDAVSYLISQGHEDIGYVGGCDHEARFRGYNEALAANRLEAVSEYIYNVRPTEAEGFRIGQQIMESEFPPSAVYCANDIIAVGMLKALSRNRRQYQSLSIISSDNIELASQISPMLTTVALPKEEMGRFAVMLLLDRIEGKHQSEVVMELKGKLLIRESVRKYGDNDWSDYVI